MLVLVLVLGWVAQRVYRAGRVEWDCGRWPLLLPELECGGRAAVDGVDRSEGREGGEQGEAEAAGVS